MFSEESWDILLMTWSILVDKNLKFHHHIKSNERLREYMDAFLFYIKESNFMNIVYVDWNDYPVDRLSFLMDLWSIYWKKVELISFKNNQSKIVEKWKWWWDQTIIEYAINNSELLSWCTNFYKVTWRYIVKNINDILRKNIEHDNVFNLLMIRKNYFKNRFVNTAFFKVNRNFFIENLWWCWDLVNDKKWIYLEKIYFDKLISYSVIGVVNDFLWFPEFSGKAWSTWKNMEIKWIFSLMIRKIFSYFGFYNIKRLGN